MRETVAGQADMQLGCALKSVFRIEGILRRAQA